MIKVFPSSAVEEKIRKQAAELNVPLSHYLAPFLKAIADEQLVMVPYFPPPKSAPTNAA